MVTRREVRHLEAWSDTDWAGCMKTRKSTARGVMIFGMHTMEKWTITNDLIALFSGEAEYYSRTLNAT